MNRCRIIKVCCRVWNWLLQPHHPHTILTTDSSLPVCVTKQRLRRLNGSVHSLRGRGENVEIRNHFILSFKNDLELHIQSTAFCLVRYRLEANTLCCLPPAFIKYLTKRLLKCCSLGVCSRNDFSVNRWNGLFQSATYTTVDARPSPWLMMLRQNKQWGNQWGFESH